MLAAACAARSSEYPDERTASHPTLSFATLLLTLDADPAIAQVGGSEIIQALAKTTSKEPMPVVLQCRTDSGCAANFKDLKAGALVIACGDPTLDDEGNALILSLRSLCKGYEDQFLNEVSITGRLSGTCKPADKSASTSVAINRFSGTEEVTDWFRIRCFGLNKDKLLEAPKGALVTASGIFEGKTTTDKKPYIEVKTRVLRLHARAGQHNAAEGKAAAGYANSDFDGSDAPPMPSDWSA